MNTWMTWSSWRPAGRLFASTMIPRLALPIFLVLCAAPQAFTQAPHWAAAAGKRSGSKVYKIEKFETYGKVKNPIIKTYEKEGYITFLWEATVDGEYVSNASAEIRTKLEFVPGKSTGKKKNIITLIADDPKDTSDLHNEMLSFKVKGKYCFRAIMELKKDGRIVAFSKTITVTVK